MGKKGGWFSVGKKVLSSESNKYQKTPKTKEIWLEKSKDLGPVSLPDDEETEEFKLTEAENEQSKRAYLAALATATVAEETVATAQAATAEVVRLTSSPHYPEKSKEEVAAIKIQTLFRGYLARKALRALKRLARLKSLIGGQSVKRQATNTLRCMQTLARMQSRIFARRIRMSEENQTLQQQIQNKHEKELEKSRALAFEGWNVSTQSKEQIEAKQQNRQEAAIRRERALAYAFSHQQSWKNCSKSVNQRLKDQNNLHWGWSWLQRWMAARPWEIRSSTDNNGRRGGSVKATCGGEIGRAYSQNDNKPSPTPAKSSRRQPPSRRRSPSTPASMAPSVSSVSTKIRQPSPMGSRWEGGKDDCYKRHSIGGYSVTDDVIFSSSFTSPSHMTRTLTRTLTRSSKVRSQLPSNGTLERGLAGTAKKQISLPASLVMTRRHSGPPKVDISSVNDVH